jgi:hypothetical protein
MCQECFCRVPDNAGYRHSSSNMRGAVLRMRRTMSKTADILLIALSRHRIVAGRLTLRCPEAPFHSAGEFGQEMHLLSTRGYRDSVCSTSNVYCA